ncbi:apolipoprotein N-acyltransferase [Buchananella hordeovulneris]|uniref:Apolipoprotein N-acyltransferase n=1 Tax=Buchananella hordeovulneris TaxID=52770 RepID=A0A1Q5PXS1_9ACTO|nr:apolipoprotein N-acyltransferase [Buchananella hordeovulneris]OKL52413.1 apolipoprotein N-acyltransferase [Buchananella hordeovulneris]
MVRAVGRFLLLLLAALTGGGLLALGHEPVACWPAALLGAGLLGSLLVRLRPGTAALLGLVAGLAFYLPLLRFIEVSLNTTWVWLVLGLLEASFVAVGGAVAAAVLGPVALPLARLPARKRAHAAVGALPLLGRGSLVAVGWAVLWTASDLARSHFPFGGFPWGNLAYTQVDSPLLRYVPWISAVGLTGLVVLLGTFVSEAAVALVGRRRSGVMLLGVLVCLVLPIPSFGTQPMTGELEVAAVQGNVARPGLDAFSRASEVTTNHMAGTLAASARARQAGIQIDIVLWPENAADLDPRAYPEIEALVDQAVHDVNAPIVVGAVRYEKTATGRVRYNELVVRTVEKNYGQRYTKQRPAPFAEYLPLRGLVTSLTSLSNLLTVDMLPGRAPAVLAVPARSLGREVKLGVGICFEVGVDQVMRQAAAGELLVIPTNNATFGWTSEAEQQLAMTRLRAAELSRAGVQVSTVGVSGIIDPEGQLLQATELFTADTMLARLPLRTVVTPAVWVGPWVERAVGAIGGLCVLGLGVRALQSRWKKREEAAQGE